MRISYFCNFLLFASVFILTIPIYFLFFDKRHDAIYRNLELKGQREKRLISLSSQSKSADFHNSEPPLSDVNDNVVWFLQVTDLHLSKWNDVNRTPDLKKFCQEEVSIIKPEAILVSGDLTDAKSWSAQDSDQYLEEWKAYKRVILESGVLDHTNWLDLRGNHDTFNLDRVDSPKNWFRSHSALSSHIRAPGGSFIHVVSTRFGNYSIVALDATPMPGPKRPYNFFGLADGNLMNAATRFARQSSQYHNGSIWFGHYPLSTIVPLVDPEDGPSTLRKVVGSAGASAYLCGHLHTFHGLIPNMYTLQPEGFLELELGDWRDGRFYRLLAFDHDIFSFVEAERGHWPLILVTNPKDARYILPHRDPVHRMAHSSHIRVLAFSLSDVTRIRIWLNGVEISHVKRANATSPLWTAPWDPSQYMDQDDHFLEVEAHDAAGRVSRLRQPFSAKGVPQWQFKMIPSFILLGDMAKILQLNFYTLWLVLLLPIVLLRILRYRPYLLRQIIHRFPVIDDLAKFSRHDWLFYPWVIYLLYQTVGPLIFGEVIDGHFGIVFVYGIYVNNSFLPEAFCYHLEYVQLLWFHTPLLLLLSKRCREPKNKIGVWYRDFWFIILLLMQLSFTFWWCWMPNGWVMTVLSPGRLWLIPWAILMRCKLVIDSSGDMSPRFTCQ